MCRYIVLLLISVSKPLVSNWRDSFKWNHVQSIRLELIQKEVPDGSICIFVRTTAVPVMRETKQRVPCLSKVRDSLRIHTRNSQVEMMIHERKRYTVCWWRMIFRDEGKETERHDKDLMCKRLTEQLSGLRKEEDRKDIDWKSCFSLFLIHPQINNDNHIKRRRRRKWWRESSSYSSWSSSERPCFFFIVRDHRHLNRKVVVQMMMLLTAVVIPRRRWNWTYISLMTCGLCCCIRQ